MYRRKMIAMAHRRLGLPADPISVDDKLTEMKEAFAERLPALMFEMRQQYLLKHADNSDPFPHEPLRIMGNRAYVQMQEMILEEFINEPIRALDELEGYPEDA